jgi:phage-related protein
VYVLHVFQKKSRKGIATPQRLWRLERDCATTPRRAAYRS